MFRFVIAIPRDHRTLFEATFNSYAGALFYAAEHLPETPAASGFLQPKRSAFVLDRDGKVIARWNGDGDRWYFARP